MRTDISRSMLSEALQEVAGPQQDLFKKLSGEQGPEWLAAFKRFLRKEEPWPPKTDALLRLVTSVSLPPVATFVAVNHFMPGEVEGVRICRIHSYFREAFLVNGGSFANGSQVETDVHAATLRAYQPEKGGTDSLFIAALGGEHLAKTTLAQMWQLVKAQGHGESGPLLTDGSENLFYIRDKDGIGTLWAVYCFWVVQEGGWYFGVRSFDDEAGRTQDDRVFSH